MSARPARRIIDISTPLAATTAGWPGDTPYRYDLAWSRADGASVNVGRIATSLHAGTHVDAPFHFDDAGATVDRLDLAPFLGPALVVDARGLDPLGPEILAGLDLARAPRVLFRTDAWPDRTRFPASIPTLGLETVAELRKSGVLLAGFDLPSVDALDSKDLPIHHALADGGIAILEGLDLRAVAPGPYELIALPLPLVGADGAPARAVLREWDASDAE